MSQNTIRNESAGLRLTRRRLVAGSAFGALGLTVLGRAVFGAAPERRPNVVFILSDDQNPDTLGCFGAKVLTPHVDGLAKGGVKFSRAYAVSSVCTPSRYTCLTGQYAGRCQSPGFLKQCPPGTQANVAFNVTLQADTPHVARTLHDAGYATGFVGKWHTGAPPIVKYPADGAMTDPKVAEALAENHRRIVQYIKECGFDYAASIYRGNLADHRLDALNVHNMEWVTRGALDFLDSCKGKPFFLHICPTLHHSPQPLKSLTGDWRVTPAGLLTEPPNAQAPRDSIVPRLREAGIDEKTAHATWLDDAVGAVLNKLEDLGVADNTLILYFSDNGTRNGKGTCYDGGAQTPCVMRWRGRIPAGVVCDAVVQNTDFAPTILEACGVAPPAPMQMDGRSLLPLVADPKAPWRDAALLEIGHTRGVVAGKWKYIALRYPPAMQKAIKDGSLGRKPYHMDVCFDLEERAAATHPGYWDADQLYDLEKDPLEKVNLASRPEHAQALAEMKARLKACLAKFRRPFGEFAS
jgi:arylsulfatase A-like enzyme